MVLQKPAAVEQHTSWRKRVDGDLATGTHRQIKVKNMFQMVQNTQMRIWRERAGAVGVEGKGCQQERAMWNEEFHDNTISNGSAPSYLW